MLDGCGCCRVCAKQMGELCTERDLCDPHKGLHCDFGAPINRRIGVCTGEPPGTPLALFPPPRERVEQQSDLFRSPAVRDGATCVFGGMVYKSGETFQSSCKYQCTCLDGAVGCVPFCAMTVRLPSPDCPAPRLVKVPGKCCEEWQCDSPSKPTFLGSALAGELVSFFFFEEAGGNNSGLRFLIRRLCPCACSLQRGGDLRPRPLHDEGELPGSDY